MVPSRSLTAGPGRAPVAVGPGRAPVAVGPGQVRVAGAIALACIIGVLTAAAPLSRAAQLASAALALPAVFWCGMPFLRGTWRSARAGSAGPETLVSLAVLASFLYATVVLLQDDAGSQQAPAGAGMKIDYAMSATIVAVALIARWWMSANSLPAAADTEGPGPGIRQGLISEALDLFVPTVMGLAGLTLALWALAGPLGIGTSSPFQFERGLDAAIAVTLVASPAALLLAATIAESAGVDSRRSRLCLGWAIAYNLIGTALAIGGLLSPVFAAIAGALACVPVVLAGRPPAGLERPDRTPGPAKRGRLAPRTVAGALAPAFLLGALLLASPGPSALAGSSGRAVGELLGIESPSPTQARAIDAMAGMDMADMTSAVRIPGGAGSCTKAACPIPTPSADELSVAGQLGSALAALWITPAAGQLEVRLELLTPRMSPVAEGVRIADAGPLRACGPGCFRFTLPAATRSATISTSGPGVPYSLTLPVQWRRGQSAAARRLLAEAVASMQSLAGVRDQETLTSGPPNPIERIDYRLAAPDRMSYSMNTGGRVVVIGSTLWAHSPGQGWQRSSYPAGRLDTRNWYDWQEYTTSVQLLEEHRQAGRMTATLALMSPGVPVWYQLQIDLASGHVSRVGMIAGGHFMVDRYSEYGAPQRILAPSR